MIIFNSVKRFFSPPLVPFDYSTSLGKGYNYSYLNYFGEMNEKSTHQRGFAIDIDGTIVLKGQVIPGAIEALQLLNRCGIPYLLLTNNVSRSQSIKAAELNNLLQLSNPLTQKQIILSYTPIKQRFDQFEEQTVLIIGRQSRLQGVLPLSFIKKYITIDEYVSLFPEAVPLSMKSHHKSESEIEEIKSRLGLTTVDKHSFRVGAILLLTVPNQWEECIQVVIDLLSTENGTVTTSKSYSYVQNHIPVMVAFNDFSHVTHEHNLPRLLMQPFTDSLKTVYKSVYHQELKVQAYGKPETAVFDFTKKHLESFSGPIEKMVMIGDNEGSDILGAYQAGWESILVKTGVAKHDSQYATINAENILDGLHKCLGKQA